MLKPALARGGVQCIGATTLAEYRKHFEKDGALVRRFQTIIVQPPTEKQTVAIIKGIKKYYEEYHKVLIPDEVAEEVVSFMLAASIEPSAAPAPTSVCISSIKRTIFFA